MKISSIKESIDLYEKNKKDSFSYSLNTLINEIDPTINIDKFGSPIQRGKNNIVLYENEVSNDEKKRYRDYLIDTLNRLPDSNGSSYYEGLDLNIGMVCDDYEYKLFKDIGNVDYISRYKLKENKYFDFIIVTSLLEGLDSSWKGVLSRDSTVQNELVEFIREMQEMKVPVIFILDEEEYDFNTFQDIAKNCQIIYTNDENNINYIKSIVNHKNVKLLEHQINPIIHNPVGIDNSILNENFNKIVFSDIWDANSIMKQSEIKRILDSIIKSGFKVDIFDEYYNNHDNRYYFPKEYVKSIYEPIEHEKLYKLYRWAININKNKYTDALRYNNQFMNQLN